jgi:hypothetical protein
MGLESAHFLGDEHTVRVAASRASKCANAPSDQMSQAKRSQPAIDFFMAN